MKSEDVAAYLQQHPEFFEQYSEMIAGINIPHPHGGRTIPISERQILSLREKSKQLENKLREIIQFGEENDAIGGKMHRITLAMLGCRDLNAVLHAVQYNLREDFAVPHVALRLWRGVAILPEFAAVSDAVKGFAAGITHPYCCAQAMLDTGALFGESEPLLKSYAYVALRDTDCFGLLAMASEDARRFYPEMGTLYLARLGEMVSAALAPHLEKA